MSTKTIVDGSASATASQIVAANANRTSVRLKNLGPSTAYVGKDSGVTTANGYPVAPGEVYEDESPATDAIYMITGSGTAEIRGIENAGALAGTSPVVVAEVTFDETTGAGVYTGSITVPAGATIVDIKARNTVLWAATTSATLKVGDVADDDGWFTGVDLKATDLLVGEELNFIQTGGKEGAYLSLTTGKRSAAYSASERVVSGIITTVGAAGAAGRTRLLVSYTLPVATAATKV